jgi:hypothetical protein
VWRGRFEEADEAECQRVDGALVERPADGDGDELMAHEGGGAAEREGAHVGVAEGGQGVRRGGRAAATQGTS